MFRNTFQCGFLSILYSIGSKPLLIWDTKVKNGHIKRITDPDIQSAVIEIMVPAGTVRVLKPQRWAEHTRRTGHSPYRNVP